MVRWRNKIWCWRVKRVSNKYTSKARKKIYTRSEFVFFVRNRFIRFIIECIHWTDNLFNQLNISVADRLHKFMYDLKQIWNKNFSFNSRPPMMKLSPLVEETIALARLWRWIRRSSKGIKARTVNDTKARKSNCTRYISSSSGFTWIETMMKQGLWWLKTK